MAAREQFDVVVVGAGNAALCTALAAREKGASVLVLERAGEKERGGNSSYTAGAFRVAYNGVDDLLQLIPDLTSDEVENNDYGAYSETRFFEDMASVTQYRTDPDLVEILVTRSFDTLCWVRDKGVRFMPMYQRQAFKKPDGGFRFWGGLTVEANGGGPGLVDALFRAADKFGAHVWYDSRALELVYEPQGVTGVVVRRRDGDIVVGAKAVVLASGGFEANSEWRARYLGPGWDLAKVRGTRHNTGDGIRMALDIGAEPYGHWSGSHAVAWDLNAPRYGDLAVGAGAFAFVPAVEPPPLDPPHAGRRSIPAATANRIRFCRPFVYQPTNPPFVGRGLPRGNDVHAPSRRSTGSGGPEYGTGATSPHGTLPAS